MTAIVTAPSLPAPQHPVLLDSHRTYILYKNNRRYAVVFSYHLCVLKIFLFFWLTIFPSGFISNLSHAILKD